MCRLTIWWRLILFFLATNETLVLAQNETDFVPLPSPFSSLPARESNHSLPYDCDEMPDTRKKSGGHRATLSGDVLVALPLFNQIDKLEADQKRFYVINLPVTEGEKNGKSSQTGAHPENKQKTTTSDSTAAKRSTQSTSEDNTGEPPDEEQIHHTHINESPFCYAPGCDGRRCQCSDCLDETDTEARSKPLVDKEKQTPVPARRRDSIIYPLAARVRELSGKDLRSHTGALLHSRFAAGPTVPVAVHEAEKQSRERTRIILQLPDGRFVSLQFFLTSLHSLLTVWRRQNDSWASDYQETFSGYTFLNVFALSNGSILIIHTTGHIIISEQYNQQWQSVFYDQKLQILGAATPGNQCRPSQAQRRILPADLFDWILDLSQQEIIRTFGELSILSEIFPLLHPAGSHHVNIDSAGNLVIILSDTASGMVFKINLSDQGLQKTVFYEGPARHFLEGFFFLGDDSIVLVLMKLPQAFVEQSYDSIFSVWTERDQKLFTLRGFYKHIHILEDGRFLAWGENEPVVIWDYDIDVDGRWRSATLFSQHNNPDANQLQAISLTDGRVITHNSLDGSLQIHTAVNDSWQSATFHQRSYDYSPEHTPLYERGYMHSSFIELGNGFVAEFQQSKVIIWNFW